MKAALQGVSALVFLYGAYSLANEKTSKPPKIVPPQPEEKIEEIVEKNLNQVSNSKTIPIELEEKLKEFPSYYKNFEQFSLILGVTESIKILKDCIEYLILTTGDQPIELTKALRSLKEFFKKKLVYVGTGILVGGCVGFGLASYFSKSPSYQSNKIATTITVSGLGAMIAGFIYSHRYRVELGELYNKLEIDLSSFLYCIARRHKSIFELKIILKALNQFLDRSE